MNSTPSWRDALFRAFTPQVARLTLASDPDALLFEEGVAAGIRARGFELLVFDDPVAFRFAYESRYRSRWDRNEPAAELVVAVQAPSHALGSLPSDVVAVSRRLSFSLDEIFPTLNTGVLRALDRHDLDLVYHAQQQHAAERRGDTATKDFVLRHVFGIAVEMLQSPLDLLRMLVRRHYRELRIPPMLEHRLIQVLSRTGNFADWPLSEILPNRESFFAFLQERWPIFLDCASPDAIDSSHEPAVPYGLKYKGPTWLPLDHDDLRVYMDNLFLEGHLRAVEHPCAARWEKTWASVGLRIDPQRDRTRRLTGLLEALENSLPGEHDHHQEWISFAHRFAELLALYHDGTAMSATELPLRVAHIHEKIEQIFAAWMMNRYGGLHNQPALPPVMVHHVPRFLARRLSSQTMSRVALLVLDGLSLDQWVTIRQELRPLCPDLKIHETAIFAWVPTMTTVSRQALFAGMVPLFFGGSLNRTDNEPEQWKRFWLDQGLQDSEVAYKKSLGNEPLTAVEDIVDSGRVRALGLVVDKVDRIVHGMQLGTAGMHNQVRQWVQDGYLASLLSILISSGFDVCLTSDHGNIEAVGIGKPAEGAHAERRGERARVYPDKLLRQRTKQRFPTTIEWPTIGLPADYHALLADGRGAFVRQGERLVGHGGIALEEVLVPLVQITSGVSR